MPKRSATAKEGRGRKQGKVVLEKPPNYQYMALYIARVSTLKLKGNGGDVDV